MREIVFDTETTGLDPDAGDRVVEIGCVEMVNHIPSGRVFHVYINPERSMPKEAFDVHGLSEEFLSDKPLFSTISDEFLDFIGDAALVAHNARFDMKFVNAEIGRLGRTAIPMHRVVDTLDIARRKHPGAPASLDALCARYGIDTSDRTLHGALLDAKLLADVYIELTGGRQASLGLTNVSSPRASTGEGGKARQRPSPLSPRLSDNEKRAHAEFVAALGGTRAWARHVRGFDAATDQPPKPAND